MAHDQGHRNPPTTSIITDDEPMTVHVEGAIFAAPTFLGAAVGIVDDVAEVVVPFWGLCRTILSMLQVTPVLFVIALAPVTV